MALTTDDCKNFLKELGHEKCWATTSWKRVSKTKTSIGIVRRFSGGNMELEVLEASGALQFTDLSWRVAGQGEYAKLGGSQAAGAQTQIAASKKITSIGPQTVVPIVKRATEVPQTKHSVQSKGDRSAQRGAQASLTVNWRDKIKLPFYRNAAPAAIQSQLQDRWNVWALAGEELRERMVRGRSGLTSKTPEDILAQWIGSAPKEHAEGLLVPWRQLAFDIHHNSSSLGFTGGIEQLSPLAVIMSLTTFGLWSNYGSKHTSAPAKQCIRSEVDRMRAHYKLNGRDIERTVSASVCSYDMMERLRVAVADGLPEDINPLRLVRLYIAISDDGEPYQETWNYFRTIGLVAAASQQLAEQLAAEPRSMRWYENPLLVACCYKNKVQVGWALELGGEAQLDYADPINGFNFWHMAAVAKPSKSVIKMLSKIPQHASAVMSTPLDLPAINGSTWCGSEIFEPKVPGAVWRSVPSGSMLHISAKELDHELMIQGLAAGLDPNERNSEGLRPIDMMATRWGSKAQARLEPMVRALAEAGADFSGPSKGGRSVLEIMSKRAPLGALEQVIEQAGGAELCARTKSAAVTLNNLSARGDQGISMAESVILEHTIGKNTQGSDPQSAQAPSRSPRL